MGHPAHTLLWRSLPHVWATIEGGSLFFFNEEEDAHLRSVCEDDAPIGIEETGLEPNWRDWVTGSQPGTTPPTRREHLTMSGHIFRCRPWREAG